MDLGRDEPVRRVVLDTAAGPGSGQLSAIDVGAARARYLPFTQTATASQWWSVADVRVYR